MKVTADWMELRVKQYEDGSFEAYEALTDTRCEGDWERVRNWIENFLATTETAIQEATP